MLAPANNSIAKRLLFYAGRNSFPGLARPPPEQNNPPEKPAPGPGVLVTSACNADEAFNESPECFKKRPRREDRSLRTTPTA